MRSLFAATFFGLFGLLIVTSVNTSSAVSVEREFYTQAEQRPAARRHASRTLHRYRPREHSRRASRWSIKRPVRPTGPPPAGYRAQLTRAPVALQSHIRRIDEINGGPVKIVAVCRPGGRFFSKTTGRWHASEHDGCRAVDFTPRSDRRKAVLAYAKANIPGYTLTYGWSPHIHIDLARASRQAKIRPKQWPVAEIKPQQFKVVAGPLPPVKVARIPLPPSRPIVASDFAALNIVPPDLIYNVALLDAEAMPVALSFAVIENEPPPAPLPSLNIFEAFADALMQPVGNCKGWEKIAPGVKRIVADATRHFSRKYNQTLIAEANSCYRDPAYNRRVGGARNSAHKRFAALDFKIVSPDHTFTVPQDELWRFCKAHPLAKGCGIYKYKGIIHADVDRVLGRRAWDWRAGRNKKFAKAKLKKKQKFAKLKSKKKKKWRRYAGR